MATHFRVALLFAVVTPNLCSDLVEMGSVRFFDSFADEVHDMVYTGGHILIECRVNGCHLSNHRLELIVERKETIASADCDKTVVFRVEITETFAFGDYQCKYGDNLSMKPLWLYYRFCSPMDPACSEACRNDGDEYCFIWSSSYSTPCVMTSNDFGYEKCYSTQSSSDRTPLPEGMRFCGADMERPLRTLCQALIAEKLHKIKTRVFDPNITDGCLLRDPTDSSKVMHWHHLAYPLVAIESGEGVIRRYNDIVSVRPDTRVTIDIPKHYGNESLQIRLNCTVKSRNGTLHGSHSMNASNLDWHISIFKSALFDSHGRSIMDIFKLQCVFSKPGDIILADTSHYVYPVYGTAVIKAIQTADGRVEALQCEPAQKLPPRFVIKAYHWRIARDVQVKFGTQRDFENETSHRFIPAEPNTYECEISLKVRCEKEKAFKSDATLKSDPFKVENIQNTKGQPRSDGNTSGCGKVQTVPAAVVILSVGLTSMIVFI